MVVCKHIALNYQDIKLSREYIGVLDVSVVYSFRQGIGMVAVGSFMNINQYEIGRSKP